jgi:hypothetical protein
MGTFKIATTGNHFGKTVPATFTPNLNQHSLESGEHKYPLNSSLRQNEMQNDAEEPTLS